MGFPKNGKELDQMNPKNKLKGLKTIKMHP